MLQKVGGSGNEAVGRMRVGGANWEQDVEIHRTEAVPVGVQGDAVWQYVFFEALVVAHRLVKFGLIWYSQRHEHRMPECRFGWPPERGKVNIIQPFGQETHRRRGRYRRYDPGPPAIRIVRRGEAFRHDRHGGLRARIGSE